MSGKKLNGLELMIAKNMEVKIQRRYCQIEFSKKVVCQECGEEFKAIAPAHLKYVHGMTMEEYRKKYPDADLTSEELTFRRNEAISKGHNR